MVGQRFVPIARQGWSYDDRGSGSDADGIKIADVVSCASIVGAMPAQHLMVGGIVPTWDIINVGCVLYSDDIIIGLPLCLACCSWCDAGSVS